MLKSKRKTSPAVAASGNWISHPFTTRATRESVARRSTLYIVSGATRRASAAQLADKLGLTLHRVDLSTVVSKYIGETEKNLSAVFDAAEQGGALLFFDEADALFGKRTDVKDSHDRYANAETNYLLQRIESWSGVVALSAGRGQFSLARTGRRSLRWPP